MRRVCILGVAASALEAFSEDLEVWAVNEAHRNLPEGRRADVVFQLHPRNWREDERRYFNRGVLPPGHDPDCFGRDQEHVDYLRACGVPVYMQQPHADVPTCVVYPFELVRQTVGIPLPPGGRQRLWATSSFGYMAALLITQHLTGYKVDELILLGVELPMGTPRERAWEWPNLAYYLGMTAGLGIKITLPSWGSSLLSAPHYALGGHPYPGDCDHWHFPGPTTILEDDPENPGPEDDGAFHFGSYPRPTEHAHA